MTAMRDLVCVTCYWEKVLAARVRVQTDRGAWLGVTSTAGAKRRWPMTLQLSHTTPCPASWLKRCDEGSRPLLNGSQSPVYLHYQTQPPPIGFTRRAVVGHLSNQPARQA